LSLAKFGRKKVATPVVGNHRLVHDQVVVVGGGVGGVGLLLLAFLWFNGWCWSCGDTLSMERATLNFTESNLP